MRSVGLQREIRTGNLPGMGRRGAENRRSDVTVAAVMRCLDVLECLSGESAPIDLTELAKRLDIPPSATHRLLTTLTQRGWVSQDEVTQKYFLSLHMSTLAFRSLDGRTLPDIVQSILERLADDVEEYCRLAVLEERRLVWVARAQGSKSGLRYDPDMGHEVVLYATANGKAWLATLPEDEAIAIVEEQGLGVSEAVGPNRARSLDEVRKHLRKTREQGFGMSVEEAEEGTVALAVPFRCGPDANEPVAGTMSIAGPAFRLTERRRPELVDALSAAAEEVSRFWPLRDRQRATADFSRLGARLGRGEGR